MLLFLPAFTFLLSFPCLSSLYSLLEQKTSHGMALRGCEDNIQMDVKEVNGTTLTGFAWPMTGFSYGLL
jgi:hypothetical protein